MINPGDHCDRTLLNTPICKGATDVRSAAASAGIELCGDDGQPFHCGQRMMTRAGIAGTDYCRCEICGVRLEDVLSPHINSGHVYRLSDEELARPQELKTWIVEVPR